MYEGVKLMIIGMGVVIFFLIFLNYAILLSSWILKGVTQREIDQEASAAKKKPVGTDQSKMISILAAAVTAFKKDKTLS